MKLQFTRIGINLLDSLLEE